MNRNFLVILVFFGLLFSAQGETETQDQDSIPTAPLIEAVIQEVHGTVEILENSEATPVPAAVGDVIKDQRLIRVGKSSRAELAFKDSSLARLGSNTIFSFDSKNRELHLEGGTALFHVFAPSGRCKISTSCATCAVLGTTVLVNAEDPATTQVHLLGTEMTKGLQVTSNVTGQSEYLQPGQFTAVERKKNARFEIRSFDVQKLWESHELGEKMGTLRNVKELKHIQDRLKTRKENASEGAAHETVKGTPEVGRSQEEGSEKASHKERHTHHRRK